MEDHGGGEQVKSEKCEYGKTGFLASFVFITAVDHSDSVIAYQMA